MPTPESQGSATVLQTATIPLALYIHMPWCVKKCPYCDFNSHTVPNGALSADLEQAYLQALLTDATQQVALAQGRAISSVFIGGGTPSLISAAGYQWLFSRLRALLPFQADCEITLEANPGTVEHAPFADYLQVGINRLSLGVQTFHPDHLQKLGRIHSAQDAGTAIRQARAAGFQRVNVDLMHGLPGQSLDQATDDLRQAIAHGATHISWYQLTIEPNTVFFRTQPQLPEEDTLTDIQDAGEAILQQQGYQQYEVSAWAAEQACRHNLNYWQFGDYLAIGAGAHGKVTQPDGVYRFQKTRLPKDYLAQQPAEMLNWQKIEAEDLPFEFMMNALRLKAGVPAQYYAQRTGLSLDALHPLLNRLRLQGLLDKDEKTLRCTAQGYRYLNNVINQFYE